MPTTLARNWINVRPGDPAFVVATNVCDWFELGNRDGDDYWLEGNIVGEGEFVFNGRLFLPGSSVSGTLIDNFPKGPTPEGWAKHIHPDHDGYQLVSQDGTVLFEYAVKERLCMVTVNIYAADGGLVAESLLDQFNIHRHPVKFGRGGIYLA